MSRYFKIWKRFTILAFSNTLSNSIDALGYFLGKIVRYVFFIVLIYSIFHFSNSLGGYGKYSVLFIFSTFHLVDISTQLFFRGLYDLPEIVQKGQIDFALVKPMNPLFFALFRYADILDALFMIPIFGVLFYSIAKISIPITFEHVVVYIVLLFFGILIATSFHILAAALTLIFSENRGIIWLYRESLTFSRFPQEIFHNGISLLFTYVMPVFIMVSYPARAFLGTLTTSRVVIGMVYSILFTLMSFLIWKLSLKKYTSPSS